MLTTAPDKYRNIETWESGWSERLLCVGLLYHGCYVLDQDGIKTTVVGTVSNGRYVEMDYMEISASKMIEWGTLVEYNHGRKTYQVWTE